jgi:hypothetical protein
MQMLYRKIQQSVGGHQPDGGHRLNVDLFPSMVLNVRDWRGSGSVDHMLGRLLIL